MIILKVMKESMKEVLSSMGTIRSLSLRREDLVKNHRCFKTQKIDKTRIASRKAPQDRKGVTLRLRTWKLKCIRTRRGRRRDKLSSNEIMTVRMKMATCLELNFNDKTMRLNTISGREKLEATRVTMNQSNSAIRRKEEPSHP